MSPSAGMPQDLLVLEEKSPPPCFLRARLYDCKAESWQNSGASRKARLLSSLLINPQRCLLIVCTRVHVCTGTLAEAGVHTRMLTCMNAQKVRSLCELSWVPSTSFFTCFGTGSLTGTWNFRRVGWLTSEPQGPDCLCLLSPGITSTYNQA